MRNRFFPVLYEIYEAHFEDMQCTKIRQLPLSYHHDMKEVVVEFMSNLCRKEKGMSIS